MQKMKGNFMKKFFCIISVFILLGTLKAEASWGARYKYRDAGQLYTGVSFPQGAGNNVADSDKTANIYKLKKGESTSRNILMLFEIGDAGIEKAARNGGVTKIHYVDTRVNRVFIPLGFIPIFVRETKTLVFGE